VELRQGALEGLDLNSASPDRDFWRGKRVLLTGHTGFKGAWLAIWLHRLGAEVVGLSLAPATTPNLFTLANVNSLTESHYCDIRNATETAAQIRASEPEIVFHLAAQALVHHGYREPLETLATNIMGTAHVLDALRRLDQVRVAVAVTTDKVYQNLEHAFPYRETDALGGYDPYSASKAAAEMVIAGYRNAFLAAKGIAIASARAGNVIGGGDWADDRLIPDAVRAWGANQPLEIRRPQAIRPWQHVLEPLAGYLRLAEQLWQSPALAGSYNFGPETHEAATVRQVIEQAQEAYGRVAVSWGSGSEGPHEAGCLTLEIAKARALLNVRPRWPLSVAIQRTLQWYRQQQGGSDARSLCEADIAAYETALQAVEP
jgi:CDP-glucose 4,6-dehydratase